MFGQDFIDICPLRTINKSGFLPEKADAKIADLINIMVRRPTLIPYS